MEDRNQHIDRYFREQLGGYTEQPAPDVWAALEQRLDEKPRKKRVLWIWFIPLFIAAIGGTVYYAQRVPETEARPNEKKAAITAAKITPAITAKANTVLSQSPKTSEPEGKPARTKHRKPTSDGTGGPKTERIKPVTDVAAPPAQERNLDAAPSQNPAANTEPLQPAEPRLTETIKPDAKQDILQLLPTAGKTVTTARPDEDNFQALAPTSGPSKLSKEIIVQAPPVKQPAQPADTVAPAVAAPAKLAKSLEILPVTAAAENPEPGQKRSNRFSAGLKTGYEFGTKPYHANSFVVSPYLQYNFSKRFGLLLQPALKYSHSPAKALSHEIYTYTTDSLKEMLPPISPNAGSRFPTGQDAYMAYQKTYDSLVIRSELKDIRYWNLDLPLMLSYKVHKNFSVYAGPNFHFTKAPKVVSTEHKYRGLVLTDTVLMKRKPMSVEFDTLDIQEVFPKKGTDISQYSSSLFDNPMINPFKMGVSFGLSYTFLQRYHFDILYRQTLSNIDNRVNEKVRELLKQPYIRVTLGFDLLK